MALAFDLRDGVGADDWETARGFLVEQFDRLYAALQPISASKFASIVTFAMGQATGGTGALATNTTIGGVGRPQLIVAYGWQQVTLADGSTGYVQIWK